MRPLGRDQNVKLEKASTRIVLDMAGKRKDKGKHSRMDDIGA